MQVLQNPELLSLLTNQRPYLQVESNHYLRCLYHIRRPTKHLSRGLESNQHFLRAAIKLYKGHRVNYSRLRFRLIRPISHVVIITPFYYM